MFVCRSCGNFELLTILSVGLTALANLFLTRDQLTQSEETFPLDLVFCPRYTWVQTTEIVSPEKLFCEYFYFSAFSDTVKQGRFARGMKLPIHAPEKLLETQLDSGLMLTWNSVDEVSKPRTEYRERGGKFMIPIPQLELDGIR